MDQYEVKCTGKAVSFLGTLSVFLLIQSGDAFLFKVGGPKGSWEVPSDTAVAAHNQWAERNRFQIGDALLFIYPAGKDSVLHVTKDDYANCNTATPLEKFTDGHTVFQFNQSGPYYFISGVKENCIKNEKLVVVVMADRSNRSSSRTASSPTPAEMPPLSPAPVAEGPPTGVEITPTQAPAREVPKKNGANSVVSSVIGSIGTFAGLFFFLGVYL